jgi:sterol desaturase/sphingolipid hydroxylase (fatty acid hydroxylase superfamily)
VHTKNHTGLARIAATFFSLTAFRSSLARMSTTRANARTGLAADTLISLLLLGAGLWRNQLGAAVAASVICCGLIFFSFVEYSFHRWLFHGHAGPLAQGHHQHHENPNGYDALPFFAPPLAMLALAGLLTILAPVSFALLTSGALAAGYAAYGLGHTAVHRWRFRQPLVRNWAAKHHIHHRHHDRNFGVTTPLWDILLGTRYVPTRLASAHCDTDGVAAPK